MIKTIRKILNGGLNSDSDERMLPAGDYVHAKNIIIRDGVRNVLGAELKSYSFPPSTNHICVGAAELAVRSKVYYFVWMSDDTHRLIEWDYDNDVFTNIVVNGTNADDDCLDLDRYVNFKDITFITRDESEGDLIYWIDSNKVPRKINIKRAKETDGTNGYGTIKKEYTNVVKGLPPASAICSFENDTTVNFNNLKRKVFQFRYRYVYDDYEKSAWSPASKVCTPKNDSNPNNSTNVNKNNKISVSIISGNKTVKKIELSLRYQLGKGWSDWYLVDTLDKVNLSIPDNYSYNYTYYGNSVLFPLDLKDSIRLFDKVPKEANCQSLVDGNTIAYAGIKEGFDPVVPDVLCQKTLDQTTLSIAQDASIGAYFLNSFTTAGGKTFYRYQIVISGNPIAGQVFSVQFRTNILGNVQPYTISVTAGANPTAASVASQLRVALAAASVEYNEVPTIVSGNIIQFAVRRNHTPINTILDGTVNPEPDSASYNTYRPKSKHQYGIVYYDEFGRSGSVITDSRELYFDSGSYKTFVANASSYKEDGLTVSSPYLHGLTVTIRHTPPSWAKYYQLVRSKDLTTDISFYWICGRIYTDTKYVYLDVSNLTDYQKRNTGTSVVYDFAQGDRIRVYKKIAGTNEPLSAGTLYFENTSVSPTQEYNLEFEIQGLVTNPTNLSGTALPAGQYIKILKPSASSYIPTSLFNDSDGSGRYLFEVFRPVKKVDEKELVFFEFGEVYQVLQDNSGNYYHSANYQSQDFLSSPNLPAIIKSNDGDFYIKQRRGVSLTRGTGDSFETFKDFWVFHEHFSDYFDSSVNSNGRPNVYDPDEKETYYPTLVRHGLQYQSGTSVNGVSTFYEENFKEYDRSYGDIVRMTVRDRFLRIFQRLKVGSVPIYQNIISDVSSNDVITASAELLNAIRYYEGDYGIGYAPGSLASSGFADYFLDSIKGVVCRVSLDGITPISILYKMNQYFRSNFKTVTPEDTYGIIAGFDKLNSLYILTNEDTVSFNEVRNRFESYMDFGPEVYCSAGNNIIWWDNGSLYIQSNTTRCSFEGIQYRASITPVFNDGQLEKKTFNNIKEISNDIWEATEVVTSTGQESEILEADFTNVSSVEGVDFAYDNFESVYHAPFMRDKNSTGGVVNGEPLKGTWVKVKLEARNSDKEQVLNIIETKYSSSNLN